MILPSLISVSVAPVSYFFWASAPQVVAVKAMTAVENAVTSNFLLERMFSPFLTFLELAEQLLSDHGDLPCAVRHQEDDEKQQNAEHGAGKTLRDSFGDIRNENDER